MKTELIYSKNKTEDIENALTEIDRFRSSYSSMLEHSDNRFWDFFVSGILVCIGFLGLRLHITPVYLFFIAGVIMFAGSCFSKRGIIASLTDHKLQKNYATLIQKDNELQALIAELKEIRDYVEISNVLQDTYARYHGSLDIKVDEKHNPDGTSYYEMNIVTQGYSDDLGRSGSIRVPGINRTFKLSRAAMDKTFSRGIIDFSWLDGNLFECARKAADIHEDMNAFNMAGQKKLPMKEDLPKAEFQNSGDNPRDILD